MSGCAPIIANRPCDFPGTKWVCSDPDIWVKIDKDHQCIGEVKINGNIKPIIVTFGQATSVGFYLYKGQNDFTEPLFNGTGKFSKSKMVINDIQNDIIFNDKYKTITFYRKNK